MDVCLQTPSPAAVGVMNCWSSPLGRRQQERSCKRVPGLHQWGQGAAAALGICNPHHRHWEGQSTSNVQLKPLQECCTNT